MEQSAIMSVSGAITARLPQPVRVLHLAVGNFSAELQLALEICQASRTSNSGLRSVLALRPAANTDGKRLGALRDKGLRLRVLPRHSLLRRLWALWRLWRAQRHDLLLVHGLQAQLLEAGLLYLLGARKLVLIEQREEEGASGWRQWLWLQLARRARLLIAPNEAQRQRLAQRSGQDARCVVVPPGIDLRRYQRAEQIAFEGRVAGVVMAARSARHEQDCLIQALGLLARRGLRLPLTLAAAGRPQQQQALQARVDALGLQGQVRFFASSAELPQHLLSHAIYVHASSDASVPQALLEAMAAGCACIVSAQSGAAEFIEPEREGLQVPSGQAEALADAIERLVSEPELAAALAAAARERARHSFGLDLMRLRYQALLTAL